MAKIILNNKTFNIDDSALAPATAELKSHLTTMNGTGATITLGGTEYSIDSTKLSTAMNSFITHLGTIAGNGSKVVVNGVEYGIDATKVAGAISELETVLGGLNNPDAPEGGLTDITWDGVVGDRATKALGFGIIAVKVSEAILNKEDLVGAELTLSDGQHLTLTDDIVFTSPDGICTNTVELLVVSLSKETYNDEYAGEVSFPAAGTYFACLSDANIYVVSLTFPSTPAPEGGLEPITWDGNTEGRVTIVDDNFGMALVKVSDTFISREQAIGGTITAVNADGSTETVTVTEDLINAFPLALSDPESWGNIMQGIVSIHSAETVEGAGWTLERGVYFVYMEGSMYVSSFVPAGSTPEEERLEGDGAEYYTLAPTALSFRSTAPLNELQEIQINGVTVDPSNYTLEEGSTIVTFPIDYLKTLNVGSYEVAVASNSKTVKGDFSVKAPELNEYGFYYNQPYVGQVQGYGNVALFYREGGVLDFIITATNYIETATYTVSGNTLTNNVSLGAIPATISNGDEIQCAALGATFKLGDTSIAADADYMYVYKEDLGGYEVKAIDKTKAEYGAIKTGINGIDTVKLADDMFYDEYTESGNTNMITVPEIPNTVITIGQRAFGLCSNIEICKIPDSVTTIGYGAFYNCRNLTNLWVGSGVTLIDNDAFRNCRIQNIYITDLSAWCGISFNGSNNNPINAIEGTASTVYLNGEPIIELVIPNGVTTICPKAFIRYLGITSVVIPDSVESIGSSAFSYCDNLTSVTIGNGVTSISDYVFCYCTNLTSVVIGNSVVSINEQAFDSCRLLTNIAYNGTTAQWNAITKGYSWNNGVPATYIQCSDGQVALTQE